ncbi:hypothetical protein [Flexivirga meconopsidis]|uniref:hypothetical protein n=1 Tax=Flexivirga meconopsidis TaxID=2977121 RepID=UPI002240CACA|nr:hypothetical protein [Flexivirga meconopsidis]
MRDLDLLVASVRDANSRKHLAEAARAYQAGAYRAAIVSTWVALAFDLVAKLRELADTGDRAAGKKILDLDAAISQQNLGKLQEFERSLLSVCKDDFELLSERDVEVLDRLRADRHVCAHPAFVSEDLIFTPTAELTRAHIAAVVDTVLRLPATPGRQLVERFKEESISTAWPDDQEGLREYLAERYFGRARESTQGKLAELIVKTCMAIPENAPGREVIAERYPKIAWSLYQVRPDVVVAAIEHVVRKKEESAGLSEDELRRAVGALGPVQALWDYLPEASVPRLLTCMRSSPITALVEAGVFSADLASHPTADAVREIRKSRAGDIDAETLADNLRRRPGPLLLDVAVARVAEGESWKNTNTLMPALSASAEYLTPDHLRTLCEAATSEHDVITAFATDRELARIYAERGEVDGLADVWSTAAQTPHPDAGGESYAYSQLRAVMNLTSETRAHES